MAFKTKFITRISYKRNCVNVIDLAHCGLVAPYGMLEVLSVISSGNDLSPES